MRELLCAKWLWKTVNENDPAGTPRVGGCQVGPRSLGTRVCVYWFLDRYPAVRIMARAKWLTIFPNRTSAGPVGRNSRNHGFRRPRLSAPALMGDRPWPALPHNWTPTNEPAGTKQCGSAPAINFEPSFILLSCVVVIFFTFIGTSVI